MTFQDPATAFLALQQGKVDGTCASEIALGEAADAAGAITLLARPVVVERWGLAIRKEETGFVAMSIPSSTRWKPRARQGVFDKWFGPATRYKMKREFAIAPIKG